MNFHEIAHNFPSRRFSQLYHVGALDRTKKRPGSHEGSGLSVTTHPDEWRKIARGAVQGNLWKLTKKNNVFLDFHRLRENHRTDIVAWGIDGGFLEMRQIYRVEYYDDELQSNVSMEFAHYDEAQDEADSLGVDAETIRERPVGTAKLHGRTGTDAIVLSFDLVTTVFVEDFLRWDGVWWRDRNDPSRYSAPRGVIVPSQVSSWVIVRVD